MSDDGSTGARSFNSLFEAVYDTLREMARTQMQNERVNHTLQATAVVNEAYMRQIDQRQLKAADRNAFLAAAANTIRRILVDHARGKHRQKRGGEWDKLEITHVDLAGREADPLDIVALDDALTKLSELTDRAAKVVELRYFGGLSVEETAEALSVSPRTVADDWVTARAWLRKELAGS
jgi:RNA polymerase sigma factor (TIGR02999 family)